MCIHKAVVRVFVNLIEKPRVPVHCRHSRPAAQRILRCQLTGDKHIELPKIAFQVDGGYQFELCSFI